MDKRGDFYRINPTTGWLVRTLRAGYGPGAAPSNRKNACESGDGSDGSDAGGYALSDFLRSSLSVPRFIVPNDNDGSVDQLALDSSANSDDRSLLAGRCRPVYRDVYSGVQGSMSAIRCDDRRHEYLRYQRTRQGRFKLTPPATILSSTAVSLVFFEGGLAITIDGWLWTLTSTGAAAIEGMSSATTLSVNNASCPSTEWLGRGANGLLVGPDGTLLFSPNLSDNSGATAAPLCAVVY